MRLILWVDVINLTEIITWKGRCNMRGIIEIRDDIISVLKNVNINDTEESFVNAVDEIDQKLRYELDNSGDILDIHEIWCQIHAEVANC